MSSEETAEIARQLLSDIGSGREPDRIALLFSKDVGLKFQAILEPCLGLDRRMAVVRCQNLFTVLEL